MFRRVSPRQRGPPAAGEGRLVVPRGSQGRKRVSLGVIQARGSPGYPLRRFYPQGVRRIRKRQSRQRLRSRCRWPSLAGQGPTHRSAPIRWGLLPSAGADLRVRPLERPFAGPWSGSGFRSRGHAMTTPMTALPNTRRKDGTRERSGASRQETDGFSGTDSGDPRPRGGTKVPERDKKRPFLLDRSAARFLFNKIEKKMGGGVHCRTPADSRPGRAAPHSTPRSQSPRVKGPSGAAPSRYLRAMSAHASAVSVVNRSRAKARPSRRSSGRSARYSGRLFWISVRWP